MGREVCIRDRVRSTEIGTRETVGCCCVCVRSTALRLLFVAGGRRGGRRYDVRECLECGHRMVWPQPTPTELREHYERSFAVDYGNYVRERELKLDHFRRKLLAVRHYASPPGRLLDVGCATGFLLEAALEGGWDPFGVDLNPAVLGHAASAVRDRIAIGTVASAAPQGNYSLITLFDVLEHSPDPREELAACRSLLAPGGVIAVQVPCVDSLAARLLGRRWYHYAPPSHLHFFTLGGLTRLCASIGLAIVEAGWTRKLLSVDYLVAQLAMTYTPGLNACRLPVVGPVQFGLPMSERLLVLTTR